MTRLYESNTHGHIWKKYDDSDSIDIFAYSTGDFHNGPRCVICGYGFCHHCAEEPSKECDKIKRNFDLSWMED